MSIVEDEDVLVDCFLSEIIAFGFCVVHFQFS